MKKKIEMQILDPIDSYPREEKDCSHQTFEQHEKWVGNVCTTSPLKCVDCGYTYGKEKTEIKERPFHILKGRVELKEMSTSQKQPSGT